MPAYHVLYLQDANETAGLLFQTVAEGSYDFEVFVRGYMHTRLRAVMDEGGARLLNMPFSELLGYLKEQDPEIFVSGEPCVDAAQASWIGEMYNRLQYELNIPAAELYEAFPLKKMMQAFRPLHTTGQEDAAIKLLQSVVNRGGEAMPQILSVAFDEDSFYFVLDDGRRLEDAIEKFPRLANATQAQRAAYVITRLGVHWPELDEDIALEPYLEK